MSRAIANATVHIGSRSLHIIFGAIGQVDSDEIFKKMPNLRVNFQEADQDRERNLIALIPHTKFGSTRVFQPEPIYAILSDR